MRLLPLLALAGILPVPLLAFEPGSLGSHYRDTGHVQGCTEETELPGCTIIAGGSQFVVPFDGPTPPEVMAALKALPPLSHVEFRGDILNVYDSYAEFALGAIAGVEGADPQGDVLRAMQGDWVSVDDPEAEVRVEGAIWTDTYGGEEIESSVISLGQGCADGSPAQGEVMELFIIGGMDVGSLCYSDLTVGSGAMSMTFVAGGGLLRYDAVE